MPLLLAAATFLSLAADPDWRRVTASARTRTYIDHASIRGEGILTADSFSAVLAILPDNPIRYTRITARYDCAAHRVQVLVFIGYGADRAELINTSETERSDWGEPGPGTDAAKLIDYVCGVDRDKAVPAADPWTDTP